MSIVVYAAQAENLFISATISVSPCTYPLDETVPHLFMKQTERLFGLYDSSLLGVAYQAFNWTADEEYNEKRRASISSYFQQTWRNGVFWRDSQSAHLVLADNDLHRWLVLVQSIASRPAGETNVFGGVEYTARSQFDINASPIRVTDSRLLELFRSWFKKTKEM